MQFLAQKGNGVKKNLASCSPRIQNDLYICCPQTFCYVSLAFAAKKMLCICSERLDPLWKH